MKVDPACAEPDSRTIEKASRSELMAFLNQNLVREYQAIIAYVAYSQFVKRLEFINIASKLAEHAAQELNHAIIIAKQIDDPSGVATVEPRLVQTLEQASQMSPFDLDNETETIRKYRERVCQCKELMEYAMGERIREIAVNERDHQVSLATALGKNMAPSQDAH